jgi:molecular chaperone IbpA
VPLGFTTLSNRWSSDDSKHQSRLEKEKTTMTRLEKEINDIFDYLSFPHRLTRTYAHAGSAYPPYNLIRISDTETVLELAVAGFKESEVSVTVEDNKLKIAGKKETSESSTEYLYKGIGTRSFERSFVLAADSKVSSAHFVDGILSVFVHYELPDEKKPKQIPITREERLYLTE